MGLSAEDRWEIQDLLIRYAAHGQKDEHELFDIFTDDAVLDGPRGYWEGREGLMGFYRQAGPPNPDAEGPLLTNFRIEGDGDHATMHARLLQRRITRIDGLPRFRDTPEYKSGARWVLHDGQFSLENSRSTTE